jgi:hypothetical protein
VECVYQRLQSLVFVRYLFALFGKPDEGLLSSLKYLCLPTNLSVVLRSVFSLVDASDVYPDLFGPTPTSGLIEDVLEFSWSEKLRSDRGYVPANPRDL